MLGPGTSRHPSIFRHLNLEPKAQEATEVSGWWRLHRWRHSAPVSPPQLHPAPQLLSILKCNIPAPSRDPCSGQELSERSTHLLFAAGALADARGRLAAPHVESPTVAPRRSGRAAGGGWRLLRLSPLLPRDHGSWWTWPRLSSSICTQRPAEASGRWAVLVT